MTNQEIVDNITKQPVGRATLVVNDRCGDPTNYLYKINSLAYHKPDLVKGIAISILTFDKTFDKSQSLRVTSEQARELVDKHYNDNK